MTREKNTPLEESQPLLSKTRNLASTYKLLMIFLLSALPTASNFSETSSESISISNLNTLGKYDALVRSAFEAALSQVNSLEDFPIEVKYNNLTKEMAEKIGLPTVLNIKPKKITTPTNNVDIEIGKTGYKIYVKKIFGEICHREFKDHILHIALDIPLIGRTDTEWTLKELSWYFSQFQSAKWENISFVWANVVKTKTSVSKTK